MKVIESLIILIVAIFWLAVCVWVRAGSDMPLGNYPFLRFVIGILFIALLYKGLEWFFTKFIKTDEGSNKKNND